VLGDGAEELVDFSSPVFPRGVVRICHDEILTICQEIRAKAITFAELFKNLGVA
jgi:hypothetical protein